METAPKTIFRRFEEVVKLFPKNNAIGYKVNGHFKVTSYKRLYDKINRYVTSLKGLGIREGTRVAIFSKNRPEWVILDLALNKIGAISVPIHTTLSPKLIKYILNDSGAEYIAIGDLYSKFQAIEKEVAVKKIITFNQIPWKEDLIFFKDLFKAEPDAAEPADFEVCTIIYTSGTTGNPKGVMLTNQNFLENIKAAIQYVPYKQRDVFLSIMPLSHVLERTGGYYAPLFFGAAIYFAESPKTLAEDIKLVKPTAIVSVPRIFEKVFDKIMDKVRASSDFKQKLFYRSLKISREYIIAQEAKQEKIFRKILFWAADRFILKKIRHNLGGRLKFSISGGASLNPSIAKFFEAIGIKILEGYGLTETSPIIAVNPIADFRFGTVGKIIPGIEVKIADDNEILVKGSNVMKGYYNNESFTRECFTTEGFLKTGDLGHLDHDGYLTIIGRKKEMLVTSTGKNVNPESLENTIAESKYISQVMIYGEKQKYLSALVVPDFEELKKYARENNWQLELFELLKYQPVIDLIKSEIDKRLKDFPDNEQIGKFNLLDREFSEEREEMTPSLKLRRNKILENYKHLI